MATEIRNFAVTIPAGTAVSAGFSSKLTIPMRKVTRIDVRVPPGPRGEVGFGIGAAGNTIVPYGGLAYIITDDESLSFPLRDAITSGAWVLYGYNTGRYDHTLYVYFYLDLIGQDAGASNQPPVDGGGLTGGGAGGDGGGGGGGDGGAPPPPIPPPVPVPPPVPTPPGTGLPVILPPALPGAGAGTAPRLRGGQSAILFAPTGVSEVWLLEDGEYVQMIDQDLVNAMVSAGVPGIVLDAGQHALFQQAYAHKAVVVAPTPPRTIHPH